MRHYARAVEYGPSLPARSPSRCVSDGGSAWLAQQAARGVARAQEQCCDLMLAVHKITVHLSTTLFRLALLFFPVARSSSKMVGEDSSGSLWATWTSVLEVLSPWEKGHACFLHDHFWNAVCERFVCGPLLVRVCTVYCVVFLATSTDERRADLVGRMYVGFWQLRDGARYGQRGAGRT